MRVRFNGALNRSSRFAIHEKFIFEFAKVHFSSTVTLWGWPVCDSAGQSTGWARPHGLHILQALHEFSLPQRAVTEVARIRGTIFRVRIFFVIPEEVFDLFLEWQQAATSVPRVISAFFPSLGKSRFISSDFNSRQGASW